MFNFSEWSLLQKVLAVPVTGLLITLTLGGIQAILSYRKETRDPTAVNPETTRTDYSEDELPHQEEP